MLHHVQGDQTPTLWGDGGEKKERELARDLRGVGWPRTKSRLKNSINYRGREGVCWTKFYQVGLGKGL